MGIAFERKQSTLGVLKNNNLAGLSPPGVFVSRKGYPKVNFSPMAPVSYTSEGDVSLIDDTDKWFGLAGEKIISFRGNLVRAAMPLEINSAQDPSYQLANVQETLMAKKPVGVEMQFKKAPISKGLSFSDFHAPMGLEGELKKFSVTGNVSVDKKIEKFYYDGDAKALDAMVELYKNSVGVNQLHKILSAGMIGIKKNRKLTPTRWSITATDSGISGYFIDEKIKYFPQINRIELFSSNYLENYFFVLLLPREWSYELLEVYRLGASWNTDSKEPSFMSDHEFFEGRKSYAQNTAGGYYAVRLAIAEYLYSKKKQAFAIVFREIGDSGLPSLGVWKCRETVRDALKKDPVVFANVNLVINYLEAKLAVPVKFWLKNSKLLDSAMFQKKLGDFN